MTGNVVFAAFALVGAPGFSLSASLFALLGFLVGAYAGGVPITRTGDDRGALLRAGSAIELAFAVVALALAAASGDPGVTHGPLGLSGGEFGEEVTDALAARPAPPRAPRSAAVCSRSRPWSSAPPRARRWPCT